MSDGNVYDADYFLRGKETGKSLYQNYRYLPELTIPMCRTIAAHLGMQQGDRVLDFGCARGYMVKALRGLGYGAYGLDASEWAIRNADDEVAQYLNWATNSPPLIEKEFDWVIAKDVLEHVPQVSGAINDLMRAARRGVFVVVPLSAIDGQPYVIPDYEKDVTHIHRLTLMTWAKKFMRADWSVDLRFRIEGIKDNYYKPGWEAGNGFITALRH